MLAGAFCRQLFGLLVVSLFLLPLSRAAAGDEGFLLVEDPWPPYTVGEAAAAPTSGLMVDLMQELFQRLDQPVTLMLHPWKRCLHMIRNNRADGLMLTVKTAEREEFAHFPEFFFVNKILFYHRGDFDFRWGAFEDLVGLTIGVVNGAKYSQEFQDAVKKYGLTVEPVSSIELNLNKLRAGRIDITPVLDVVAARTIAENPAYEGIVANTEKPLRVTPMQMAVSRSSKLMDYREQIDKTIREMKSDGTVKRLYDGYVPQQPVAAESGPKLGVPGGFSLGK